MPSIERLRLYGGIPSGANVLIIEDRDGKPIGEVWPGVAKGTYSSRHFVSGRYFYGNTWEKAISEVEENDKIARTFQLAIR